MTLISPPVSVIIPTKNSSQTLEDCLVSLKKQTYENIEIIVVDNFSTDATASIAEKYANFVFQKGPERTTQKNHGIAKSSGEYVMFIDSDMILEPGVIAECVSILESDAKVGGVCIGENSVGKGIFVEIRDFERSFYGGSSVESARFFRKKDVVQVGGFEEDIIFFEESLLPQKIEARLELDCSVRIESLIHHQEGDITLISWLKKKFYYGKSLGVYQKKTQEIGIVSRGNDQMNVLARYMIFLKEKRFYTKPILAIGVLLLKTAEFGAGGIGFIWNKIR